MSQQLSAVAASSAFIASDGRTPDAESAWLRLAHLEAVYPGFHEWYRSKVVPELAIGRRRMFVRVGSDGYDGIVIAKRGEEAKLCTIWTAPAVRNRGIADTLIGEAMDWMETDRPLLTIPEERMYEFSGLLVRRGFQSTETLMSYYRRGRAEHVFNGLLRPATSN